MGPSKSPMKRGMSNPGSRFCRSVAAPQKKLEGTRGWSIPSKLRLKGRRTFVRWCSTGMPLPTGSRSTIRRCRCRRNFPAWVFFLANAFALASGAAPTDQAPSAPLTRQGLIGAWRLVRIEYRGPHGSTADPFYQQGSTGLLIYDASGWMSVRIAAPGRRGFEVPGSRPAADEDARLDASKASAFDSYYAYDGTWDFHAETSELVHHVVSSLLPAESGMTYTQTASLEAGRLVFYNRSVVRGEPAERRKIWERIRRR